MNKISFEQFIMTYNFRILSNHEIESKTYNSEVIRIYPPVEDFDSAYWFEFGVYDFGPNDFKWQICKDALSDNILKSYVDYIYFDEELCTLEIHLTHEKKYNNYN